MANLRPIIFTLRSACRRKFTSAEINRHMNEDAAAVAAHAAAVRKWAESGSTGEIPERPPKFKEALRRGKAGEDIFLPPQNFGAEPWRLAKKPKKANESDLK